MPRLTREWIDRQRMLAENTWVAETASGVIVVAHPSQKAPDPKDRKFLRDNFGLLPDVEIKPLIDTAHSPDFERLERELAIQGGTLEERIAYHRQELVRLMAERAAITGVPLPLPADLESAILKDALEGSGDALPDGEGETGDGGGDEERTVATVGGGGKSRRTPASRE